MKFDERGGIDIDKISSATFDWSHHVESSVNWWESYSMVSCNFNGEIFNPNNRTKAIKVSSQSTKFFLTKSSESITIHLIDRISVK